LKRGAASRANEQAQAAPNVQSVVGTDAAAPAEPRRWGGMNGTL